MTHLLLQDGSFVNLTVSNTFTLDGQVLQPGVTYNCTRCSLNILNGMVSSAVSGTPSSNTSFIGSTCQIAITMVSTNVYSLNLEPSCLTYTSTGAISLTDGGGNSIQMAGELLDGITILADNFAAYSVTNSSAWSISGNSGTGSPSRLGNVQLKATDFVALQVNRPGPAGAQLLVVYPNWVTVQPVGGYGGVLCAGCDNTHGPANQLPGDFTAIGRIFANNVTQVLDTPISSSTITFTKTANTFTANLVSSPTTRNVMDYGAHGDCATDDSAAINSAISVGPGFVYLPPLCFAVANTIFVPSGVTLYGNGVPNWNLANRVTGFSTLSWTGATNATAVWVGPATTGPSVQLGSSANLDGISVQCNGVAGIGVLWTSVWQSDANVYAEECNINLFKTAVASQLQSHTDVCRNYFTLSGRQGQTLATRGPALYLTGNSSASAFGGDTCLTVFDLDFLGNNNSYILVANSDHNLFQQVAYTGGLGGPCMWFAAGNATGPNSAARKNLVISLACGANHYVYFEGTENGSGTPSTGTVILYSQMFITPTFGTGADANFWCNDGGICNGNAFSNAVFGDNFGIARNALAYALTLTTEPAVYIASGASAHVVLATAESTPLHTWALNINGGSTNGDARLYSQTDSAAMLAISNPVSEISGSFVSPLSCTAACNANKGPHSFGVCGSGSAEFFMMDCATNASWAMDVIPGTAGSLRIIHLSGTNATVTTDGNWHMLQRLYADAGLTVTGGLSADTCSCASSTPITEKNAGLYPVSLFGAVADCATDDGPAIQAAINAAAAAGGGTVVLTPACYALATPLSITASHVLLSAPGTSMWTGGNLPQTSGVRFNWTGSSGASMLTVTAISGTSNQQISGVNVVGISFLCNGVAGVAVDVFSQWGGIYSVYAENCNTALMRVQTVPRLSAHVDSQELDISLYGDQSLSSTGYGLYMQGNISALPTAGNPSDNIISTVDILACNGSATLYLGCSDHNQFKVVRQVYSSSTCTAPNVVFAAGGSVAAGSAAVSNVIRMLHGKGAITAQGTETATYPSINNVIEYIDFGNAAPFPSIGTSATLYWGGDDGIFGNYGMFTLSLGGSLGVARAAQSAQTTQSLYIANGSGNHVTLSSPDGTTMACNINIDPATNNLRISCPTNSSAWAVIQQPITASQMLIVPTAEFASEQLDIGNGALRVYSGSSNHVQLTDGTNAFAINIDSVTGNLRITRMNGSGLFAVTPTMQLGNSIEVAGWACIGCSSTPTHNTAGDGTATRFWQGSNQVVDTITCPTGFTCTKSGGTYTESIGDVPQLDQEGHYRQPAAAALQTADIYGGIASGVIACGTIVAAIARSKTAQTLNTFQVETGSTAASGITHFYGGVWDANGNLLYTSDDMAASAVASTVVTVTFTAQGPMSFSANTNYYLGVVMTGTTCTGFFGINRASSWLNGYVNNYGTSKLVFSQTGFTALPLLNLTSAGTLAPMIRFNS